MPWLFNERYLFSVLYLIFIHIFDCMCNEEFHKFDFTVDKLWDKKKYMLNHKSIV